jgi:hypothetical protein
MKPSVRLGLEVQVIGEGTCQKWTTFRLKRDKLPLVNIL